MHKCPGIFARRKCIFTKHNIVKILIYFHCNQNDRLAVREMAKSHDFKGIPLAPHLSEWEWPKLNKYQFDVMSQCLILTFGLQWICYFGCNGNKLGFLQCCVLYKWFLLGKYTITFMHSAQTIRLQVEYVPSLLCWYCKWTDIYYSTWSFENVAKICHFQFLDPPKTH